MSVVEISEENASDFMDFLDVDTADDLGRVFFRGIGLTDDSDNPEGAFVYELLDSDGDDDTKSNIKLFNGENDSAMQKLEEEYRKALDDDEVVKSFYETSDDKTAAQLSGAGFSKEQGESKRLVFSLSELEKLPLKRTVNIPSYIMSISELSALQYRNAIKDFLFKGLKGSIEDLAYLPMSWFERSISSCVMSNGKVDGLLLVRKTPSGELHAMLFAAFGPDYVKNLGLMLVYSVNRALETYPPDTKVVINRHNDEVKALAKKLAPDQKGAIVWFGSRDE